MNNNGNMDTFAVTRSATQSIHGVVIIIINPNRARWNPFAQHILHARTNKISTEGTVRVALQQVVVICAVVAAFIYRTPT
jgi:hypothetical protein